MKYFLAITLLLFFTITKAQQSNEKPNQLNVFVDCNNYGSDCFDSFLRQEISLVTFVRDRLDADVHIIATSNWNNLGTQMNTLFVVGQKKFSSLSDTLSYSIPPNSTDLERRDIWTKQIKIALLPYVARTQLVQHLNLTMTADMKPASDTTPVKDPYNFWVFQLSTNGSINGNRVSKEFSAYGNASANRETEESKSNIYLNASEQYNRYDDQGTIYQYEYQDFGAGASHMKKMTEHFGAGLQADFNNSIYSNLKARYTAGPVVEYSYFPYKEFNSKRLVVQYAIDARYNKYYDTTIYLKTKEVLFAQEVAAIGSFTQKWGSINVGAFWRNLFTDFSKNSLSFNGAITARLVKGLNFVIWGNYSFIHNQLNIRKGDISIDQLLAQNREILSAYNYNLGIGLSYRFGSKFNSAVNPCFRGLNYSINL